jgi:AraC-like DNA-binding protein
MTPESDPKGYLYKRIVRAKLFVDTHFSESIGVSNIASEAFLSSYHFIRLFKRIYNRKPHQYLTSVRIERAKELLHSGVPVSDVCYSVGFESTSSFTGLFKRRVGRTPSAYQNRQHEIRAQIERIPLKFVPACFAEKQGWAEKSNFREASE